MSWDGRTANEVWLRCFDCVPPRSFREVDYRHHVNREHPERPEPDAMTILEVARALKTGPRRVRWLVTTGKIASFRVEVGGSRRRQWWVRPKALRDYIHELVEKDPGKALEWAETGAVK